MALGVISRRPCDLAPGHTSRPALLLTFKDSPPEGFFLGLYSQRSTALSDFVRQLKRPALGLARRRDDLYQPGCLAPGGVFSLTRYQQSKGFGVADLASEFQRDIDGINTDSGFRDSDSGGLIGWGVFNPRSLYPSGGRSNR